MKKILILMLTFVIAISVCLLPLSVQAESAPSSEIDSKQVLHAVETVKNFVNNNSDRRYATKGEYQAGEYVANEFVSMGINSVKKMQIASDNANSYNIVATIDVGSNDTIIVGAHYDATGNGASDNATGLATLLLVGEQLQNNIDKLNCNVMLVAFCGEESGLLGSTAFVNQLYALNLAVEDINLMINIDCIANGDNLYVQGELVATNYVDTLIKNTSKSVDLSYKPFSKGLQFAYDVHGYGYYEVIQNSDHTPFALAGIPTAFFFSGNYDLLGGYVESTDVRYQLMNTDGDTLENIREGYGERIVAVSHSIVTSLIDSASLGVLLDARSELVPEFWFNDTYAIVLMVVIIIVIAVFAVNYYKKLVKRALMGNAEVKDKHMFSSPNVNDIFDLGGSAKKNENDKLSTDVNDIFDLGDKK